MYNFEVLNGLQKIHLTSFPKTSMVLMFIIFQTAYICMCDGRLCDANDCKPYHPLAQNFESRAARYLP